MRELDVFLCNDVLPSGSQVVQTAAAFAAACWRRLPAATLADDSCPARQPERERAIIHDIASHG